MSKHDKSKHGNSISDNYDISETFMILIQIVISVQVMMMKRVTQLNLRSDIIDRESLIFEQEHDAELMPLLTCAVSEDKAQKLPTCFYLKSGVLLRKWRPVDIPPENEWEVCHQIVVPSKFRFTILSLAHERPMAGHLGIKKTCARVLRHFYWPKLKQSVKLYCRTCHTCQIIGKPNQGLGKAPLKTIPVTDELFSKLIIDCVGPLPKTKSGKRFLLTVMCSATRFPEAFPLRNIESKTVCEALKGFFCTYGFPKVIQSDRGTNFLAKRFKQLMLEMGVEQMTSSAYHPQSQGALERFHQTLKTMLCKYCFENEKDWDQGVPLVLFAARESVQESLGFSPFELIFGHSVRGPLKLMKERWLSETPQSDILTYVSSFKSRLSEACKIANDHLTSSHAKMKVWYDKNARKKTFKAGDQVLVMMPVLGHPLHAKYNGPYVIERAVGDLD